MTFLDVLDPLPVQVSAQLKPPVRLLVKVGKPSEEVEESSPQDNDESKRESNCNPASVLALRRTPSDEGNAVEMFENND